MTSDTKKFFRFLGSEAVLCVAVFAVSQLSIIQRHPWPAVVTFCAAFAWIAVCAADNWRTANRLVGIWIAFLGGLFAITLAAAAITYPW